MSENAPLNLVVTHLDNVMGYYPLWPDRGWKIDTSSRCLVVKSREPGHFATMIPLDNVRSFVVQDTLVTGLVLRDYQRESLEAVERAWADDIARPAVVLATGLGKTVVFAELARREARLGRKTGVIVHREELASQTAAKVRDADPSLSIGVVKAERDELGRDVTILSAQTLARSKRLARVVAEGDLSLVVVDECHHAAAKSYLATLDALGCMDGGTRALGVTATMARGDGKALGRVWQKIVIERDVVYGIAHGHLVDVRGIQVTIDGLDLATVARQRGDYSDAGLGDALEEVGASDALVKAHREHADGRQGIIFAPTVATAELFAEACNAAGIVTMPITGTTHPEVRKAIYSAYRAGGVELISSCMVLTEGFDMPQAAVAHMMRPTSNAPLYVQMAGRVLRPHPGKTEALLIDYVGASSIGLRSISDLGRARVKPGESLAEAMQRAALDPPPWDIEPRGDGAPDLGEVDWKSVDLFAASRTNWLRTRAGLWFIPTASCVLFLRDVGDGRYQIGRSHDQYKLKANYASRHGYLMDGKDFSESMALAWGEQLAEELDTGLSHEQGGAYRVSHRDSQWRKSKAAASQAQKDQLARMGVPLPEHLTKNDASDLLSVTFASRMLD